MEKQKNVIFGTALSGYKKQDVNAFIASLNANFAAAEEKYRKEIAALNDKRKDGKDLSDEDRNTLNARENDASVTREEEDKLIADYASKQDKVKQLVDIALLGNGMLKGEALSKFLERSISLL